MEVMDLAAKLELLRRHKHKSYSASTWVQACDLPHEVDVVHN